MLTHNLCITYTFLTNFLCLAYRLLMCQLRITYASLNHHLWIIYVLLTRLLCIYYEFLIHTSCATYTSLIRRLYISYVHESLIEFLHIAYALFVHFNELLASFLHIYYPYLMCLLWITNVFLCNSDHSSRSSVRGAVPCLNNFL